MRHGPGSIAPRATANQQGGRVVDESNGSVGQQLGRRDCRGEKIRLRSKNQKTEVQRPGLDEEEVKGNRKW